MPSDITLFISHTVRDQRDSDLAHKLAAGLKAWGVNVWIAPESIPTGEDWKPAIALAVQRCSHFLVILSEASVRSEGVPKEIELARSRLESGAPLKILPLRVGSVTEFAASEFLAKFQDLPYEKQFAKQLRAIAAALALPPQMPGMFRTLIEDTTRHFVGRSRVFATIQQFLANESKGYFTLVGDPGEGKTTLIAKYVRETGCPAHFNSAPGGIDSTAQFFDSVKAQLGTYYGVSPMAHPGESPSFSMQLSELLQEAAEARPEGEPFVLAVDALDEVKPELGSGSPNVLQLPPVLPDGIFILLSRRRKALPFDTRAPHVVYDLKNYPADSRQDVERYLMSRLSDAAFEPWLRVTVHGLGTGLRGKQAGSEPT
jgi:hypothetical protein